AVVDDADETERRSSAASPHPGGLAAACVVVVQADRDLLLVVGLLPQRQLRNAQHSVPPTNSGQGRTLMHHRCFRRCRFSKRATPPPYVLRTADAQKCVSGGRGRLASRPRKACSEQRFSDEPLSAQTP